MSNVKLASSDNNSLYFETQSKLISQRGKFQSPRFTKDKVYINLSEDLTTRGLKEKDIYYLDHKLCNMIDFDNVLVIYDSKLRHKRPVLKEELASLLDMSDQNFRKFFRRLEKANLVIVDKSISSNDVTSTRIYLNPYYAQKGYAIDPYCWGLFRRDFDNLFMTAPESVTIFNNYYNSHYGEHSSTNATEYLLDDEAIFSEYVLNNKEADLYHFESGTFFLLNESATAGARKASDIVNYRNLFIDIDSGKDKDGNYFSLEEVAKRKESMLHVIRQFPAPPTVITETRNGFHCIWSIEETTNKLKWEHVENLLVNLFKIADKAVKDSSRVLRLPFSTWSKKGYETFETSIKEANAIRYNLDELKEVIEANVDDIHTACDEYLSKYKETAEEAKESRIREFQACCSAMELNVQDLQSKELTYNSFIDQAKQLNLRSILKLPKEGQFCCIFHDDKTPSADIFVDKSTNYQYYWCHSSNCEVGTTRLDIFEIIGRAKNMKFIEAVRYLANLLHVKLINNESTVAAIA